MASKKTLLDRALAHEQTPRKLRVPIKPEEVDVALAWMRGDINLGSVTKAYNHSGGTSLYRIAVCLREAYRQGQIQVAA